jgi:hypothetical protein
MNRQHEPAGLGGCHRYQSRNIIQPVRLALMAGGPMYSSDAASMRGFDGVTMLA